jgi:hypothetical protein
MAETVYEMSMRPRHHVVMNPAGTSFPVELRLAPWARAGLDRDICHPNAKLLVYREARPGAGSNP